MSKFGSVDEILDFAIRNEDAAHRFYVEMARKTKKPNMTNVFEELAEQETLHKERLMEVRAGKKLLPVQAKITDLKIGDYLYEPESGAETDYQGALTLAMHREKRAYRLYMDLMEATEDAGLKDLFHGLAQQEAMHKLRLEREYDDHVLIDN